MGGACIIGLKNESIESLPYPDVGTDGTKRAGFTLPICGLQPPSATITIMIDAIPTALQDLVPQKGDTGFEVGRSDRDSR